MTTTKPKARRITGVCSTEEYLPEPKLDGALLRLRNDLADFSRVAQDAVSMLSNHNEERVLGTSSLPWRLAVKCGFRRTFRLARACAASTNTYAILMRVCAAVSALGSVSPR